MLYLINYVKCSHVSRLPVYNTSFIENLFIENKYSKHKMQLTIYSPQNYLYMHGIV